MAYDVRADKHPKDHLCLRHWLLLTWASWDEISQLDRGIQPSMEGRRHALEKAGQCRRCTSSADAQVVNTALPRAGAGFGDPPTHTRYESGRSWVIVGIALVAAAVALMANTVLHSRGAPAAARTGVQVQQTMDVDKSVDSADLKKGDCLPRGIPAGDVWMVKVGSCHQPHREEVYAVFKLAPRHFRGQKSVDRRGDAGCRKRFKGYVGIDYGSSQMDYYAVTPWITDLSLPVVCVVVDVHRDSTTLKGARR